MKTLFISHGDCEKHEMSAGHPESPQRLRAIADVLSGANWSNHLHKIEAAEISGDLIEGIHPAQYLQLLAELKPGEGLARSVAAYLEGIGKFTVENGANFKE